jgi:molecular chaperone DnaK
LEGGDPENIKAKTEALKQVSYKIAEEVYKQTGAEAAAGGSPGGGADGGGESNSGGGDNTRSAEDADYEVVDDDKK